MLLRCRTLTHEVTACAKLSVPRIRERMRDEELITALDKECTLEVGEDMELAYPGSRLRASFPIVRIRGTNQRTCRQKVR
jgi:hypothetical protein